MFMWNFLFFSCHNGVLILRFRFGHKTTWLALVKQKHKLEMSPGVVKISSGVI